MPCNIIQCHATRNKAMPRNATPPHVTPFNAMQHYTTPWNKIHDRNYHTPSYHSNQSTPKYVTLHPELGHDRNYHIPSYHSNQPTPKYVTLHPELGHDRNYHTPSYHSNPAYTHHSNQIRTRSIVTHYARSIVTHLHSNTSTPPLSFWGAIKYMLCLHVRGPQKEFQIFISIYKKTGTNYYILHIMS